MENKNILPISYEIFYDSQEGGFLISTWLMIGMKMLVRNHERSIRIYNIFLIVLLSRIVKINGVNYLYNSFDNIIEINETPYNIQ